MVYTNAYTMFLMSGWPQQRENREFGYQFFRRKIQGIWAGEGKWIIFRFKLWFNRWWMLFTNYVIFCMQNTKENCKDSENTGHPECVFFTMHFLGTQWTHNWFQSKCLVQSKANWNNTVSESYFMTWVPGSRNHHPSKTVGELTPN